MNFLQWSTSETVRTPLSPSETNTHMYDLPVITHVKFLGGKRLSDDDYNELIQFLELAYNRGRELGTKETKKEISHGET